MPKAKRTRKPRPVCDVCSLSAGWMPLRVMVPVPGLPVAVERLVCRGCQGLVGPIYSTLTLAEMRAKRPEPLPDYP